MTCWMKLNPRWVKKLESKLLLIRETVWNRRSYLRNRSLVLVEIVGKIWLTPWTTFLMTDLNWISTVGRAQHSEPPASRTVNLRRRASVFHSWSEEVRTPKACPPLSPGNAVAISDVTTAILALRYSTTSVGRRISITYSCAITCPTSPSFKADFWREETLELTPVNATGSTPRKWRIWRASWSDFGIAEANTDKIEKYAIWIIRLLIFLIDLEFSQALEIIYSPVIPSSEPHNHQNKWFSYCLRNFYQLKSKILSTQYILTSSFEQICVQK